MSTSSVEQVAARAAADGVLRWVQLFGRGSSLPATLCLHLELSETAFHLSDERVTAVKLQWWVDTLRAGAGARHPLLAALLPAPAAGALAALGEALLALHDASTPGDASALWTQASRLATPCAALVGSDAAHLALHGLLWRLRLPLPGPHNAGLCPLDLRARHQLPSPLPPSAWPAALRRDWLSALQQHWQEARRPPRSAADAALAALLARELRAGLRRPSEWQPGRSSRGFGALWQAWRAAVRVPSG